MAYRIMHWNTCIMLQILLANGLYVLGDASEKDKPLDNFMDNYNEVRNYISSNYPKPSNSNQLFPPPKGSTFDKVNIGANPYHYPESYNTVTTNIKVVVSTSRIVKMDIEQQSLVILALEMFTWNDQSLRWKGTFPNHTSQVENMIMTRDEVWVPPIFAKNALNEEVIRDWKDIFTWSTGTCFTERVVQYTIPCTVNVREFPFDIHNCSLVLSQPFQFHFRLNFTELTQSELQGESLADLMYSHEGEHLQWELIGWNNFVTPHKDWEQLPEFKYTLVLRRRATFYFTVLILPCIVLNLLSLTVFALPVVDTGRMDFCLALILTYFVLIMIVVDSSPPSGNQIPLLGLYIILSTVVVGVSFGMSMILVEIHEHCRVKMKPMSKFLTNVLEKYCCLSKRYIKYKNILKNDDGENGGNDSESFPLYKHRESKVDDFQLKESFKWKLLGKVLNLVFCVMVISAHIVIPMVIFISPSSAITKTNVYGHS